jgi:5-carboxymethyl-2-hydroxymuconate isomerase
MPHIVVEFSQNLERHADVAELLAAVHGAAHDTGAFTLDTIRTRAEPRANYLIGDGAATNAFLAIDIRMGPGASEATRTRIARHIFAAADRAIAGARAHLTIKLSLELRESSAIRLREEAKDGTGGHKHAE